MVTCWGQGGGRAWDPQTLVLGGTESVRVSFRMCVGAGETLNLGGEGVPNVGREIRDLRDTLGTAAGVRRWDWGRSSRQLALIPQQAKARSSMSPASAW